MVGRFESAGLTREALAYEARSVRRGLIGVCAVLLLGVALVVSLQAFSSSPHSSSTIETVAPTPVRISPDAGLSEGGGSASLYAIYGLGPDNSIGLSNFDVSAHLHRGEDVSHLGIDSSLLAICIAAFAFCFLPPLFRWLSVGSFSGSYTPSGSYAPSSWSTGFGFPSIFGGNQQGSMLNPQGSSGSFFPIPGSGAVTGRVVDVKPGELSSGRFGGMPGATSAWHNGANGAVDWSNRTGLAGGGSWLSPVPSPYSSAASGIPGIPGAISNSPGQHGGQYGHHGGSMSSSGGGGFLGGLGLGSASRFSSGFGQSPGGAIGHGLPTEAEVTDTYASFGVEMQQWTHAVADMVDKQVVEPLMRELDEMDQFWQQSLAQHGMKFSFEAPRMSSPGLGPSTQELSVFDRNLPSPLCNDPTAVNLWSRRQQLERFLTHPSFEPAQRQYVHERLREWRSRGLMNSLRYEWRPSDALPTDAHILENLIVQTLNMHLDFAGCFISTGHAPPCSKHLGQSPTAYLRQVTDQSQFPRPVPHYEVVTLTKAWKLRTGNANILEAVALLLHALRRHSARSYQAFPQMLRTSLESAAGSQQPQSLESRQASRMQASRMSFPWAYGF